MQTFHAKVGTMPMDIIILWGNKPPKVGQRIRWKERQHRARWEYAIVDRIDLDMLFISRM